MTFILPWWDLLRSFTFRLIGGQTLGGSNMKREPKGAWTFMDSVTSFISSYCYWPCVQFSSVFPQGKHRFGPIGQHELQTYTFRFGCVCKLGGAVVPTRHRAHLYQLCTERPGKCLLFKESNPKSPVKSWTDVKFNVMGIYSAIIKCIILPCIYFRTIS